MSAKRILIVEDEGIVAMLAEDILVDLGHEVVGIVGTLAKAHAMLDNIAFDLAILDVNLNGEHTYALAERLKERGIPFVFATGYGREGLEPKWRDAPVLGKPYQPAEMERLVNRLLGL